MLFCTSFIATFSTSATLQEGFQNPDEEGVEGSGDVVEYEPEVYDDEVVYDDEPVGYDEPVVGGEEYEYDDEQDEY